MINSSEHEISTAQKNLNVEKYLFLALKIINNGKASHKASHIRIALLVQKDKQTAIDINLRYCHQ